MIMAIPSGAAKPPPLRSTSDHVDQSNRENRRAANPQQDRVNSNFFILLGICFLRVALEVAVEGIGDGEKGG